MAQHDQTGDQAHYEILEQLVFHHHYQSVILYLETHSGLASPRLLDLLNLGHAFLHTDLVTIENLAPKVGMTYLTEPNLLQRRVYSYTQGLAIKLKLKEYDDYLRALTPLLVDILRLLLEKEVLPDLDSYLIEVMKKTPQGVSIYRGLQWNQSLIEMGPDDRILNTWKRYYGDYFNYSHYVSSSHLIKLVIDYVSDQELVQEANQLRQIEKYARNIVAHELIYVDDEWLEHRVQMRSPDIHQLILSLVEKAGLTDPKQWSSLADIQKEIVKEMNQVFHHPQRS